MMNIKKEGSRYVNESLNQTSFWNSEEENIKQGWLKTCCATAFKYYKIRTVKNKRALIVLLISFLVTSTAFLFKNRGEFSNNHHNKSDFLLYVWVVPFAISAFLTGLIADTLTGRYAVIKTSVWITWLFMIISTIFAVVAQFTNTYYKNLITNRVLPVTLNALGFGLGGFHANIIQFGLDQLHDASTTEITTFITWFASTIFSSGFVVEMSKIIVEYAHNPSLIYFFIMCILLTMAVLLLICCDHLLIKEPPSKNPFRLIYNVIRFAIKNKHPRCRSAFTYCEDELPSRIDFGKSKYGGPFSTEQVEDVKTFLRLLTLIISFAVLAATLVGTVFLHNSLSMLHIIPLGHLTDHKRLLLINIISSNAIVDFIVILLLVLNEFAIYPLFHPLCTLSDLNRIKSLSKIMLGLILNLINLFILMALNLTSRHLYLFSNGYNSTLQCYLYERNGILHSTVSEEWFIIPRFFLVLSSMFFVVGIIEFLSSQSPYAMRGTLFGMLFSTISIIFLVPGVAVIAVFLQHFTFWSTKTVSCGFWYILIVIIIYSIGLAVFLYLKKRYKMRKREDVLPNEHIFAERYYSQET